MLLRTVQVLGAVAALTAGATAPAGAPADDTTPEISAAFSKREMSPREQAVHALNRLAFGARPGDVDRVIRMGVDRWIEQQLTPQRIQDVDADRLMSKYPALAMTPAELFEAYPPPGAKLLRRRLTGDVTLTAQDSAEFRRAARSNRAFASQVMSTRVARAVVSERQLQEVMTDFWENHFSVFVGKGQVRYYLPDYDRETIGPHVLGKFRDLLGAVARSPAMLIYLDNAQSAADTTRPTLAARRRLRQRGLNENYARELLELHTLGVDGGYTQGDVIGVARAFTGWSIRPPRLQGGGFVFRPEAHDAGSKTVLGHTLPAGRGMDDGETVLDILARHPSTARYIARKLAIRFVSDSPPPDLVERAAETFRRSDGDIRQVIRSIVTSPEFFARSAWQSKVKTPFEVTVSALRALNALPDTTPRSAAIIGRLGQPIFGHQAPNGWPETGEAWMNTGAILNRINFGVALAQGVIPGAEVREWPPYDGLLRASREQQVDSIVTAFFGGSASPETLEILRSGKNPMLETTSGESSELLRDEDAVSMREDTDSTGAGRRAGRRVQRRFGNSIPLAGLDLMIGLALGSPEFQRR
jgi:uncharacterized protein (DUF1800 family)